jgi:single-stranded-DNA-specific exonuclease
MSSPLRTLGFQGQHAKFRVSQGEASLDVIAFQQAKQLSALPPAAALDIAFTPSLNTWQGRHEVQLQLRAIRAHTAA